MYKITKIEKNPFYQEWPFKISFILQISQGKIFKLYLLLRVASILKKSLCICAIVWQISTEQIKFEKIVYNTREKILYITFPNSQSTD